jgi:dolichol-phosphate mannosyltransferase
VKIVIVIPTYNEAENLPEIVPTLLSLPFNDLQIIVVDDNSPDGTGMIADQLAADERQHLVVIHRPNKQGLGSAYVIGFQRALLLGADIVVQMDADFSHSPHYIPHMVTLLETHDVVVGSRFVQGGHVDRRWSWWRYFLSWWANKVYARAILGIYVNDATAGFKALRRHVLETIDLHALVSNGYVFQVEVAYLCQKLGVRTVEIPIYFEDRRIGRSKMDVPVKVEAVWRVWQIRWRYRHLQGMQPEEASSC